MDNNRKIEWLGRYKASEATRRYLAERRSVWRSRTESVTRAMDAVPGGGSGAQVNKQQRAVEEIARLDGELAGQLAHSAQVCREIEAAIGAVTDRRLGLVLRLRYLNGLTWEGVAEGMRYSEMHTLRLHKQALSGLDIGEAV